jgi:hypothetical protein
VILALAFTSVARREDIRYPGKLNLEDDLAELRAGFEIGVSVGGFGEREDTINYRLQATGSDEFHYRVQFGLRAHVGAKQ